MKNNGGWGLRAELVICLVLTIFFGVAVVLIGKVVSRLNEDININKKNDSEVVTDNKNDDIIINESNNVNNNVVLEEEKKPEESINYSVLEDKLVSAGVLYANKYYNNDTLIVTVVRLQTENLLDQLIVNDVECSGYIEIKKDESFKYYPYIKCGDLYQTKGYDETKDNLDN